MRKRSRRRWYLRVISALACPSCFWPYRSSTSAEGGETGAQQVTGEFEGAFYFAQISANVGGL